MALEAETKNIVAKFDYLDGDVNTGVREFLRQMGTSLPLPPGRATVRRVNDAGAHEGMCRAS